MCIRDRYYGFECGLSLGLGLGGARAHRALDAPLPEQLHLAAAALYALRLVVVVRLVVGREAQAHPALAASPRRLRSGRARRARTPPVRLARARAHSRARRLWGSFHVRKLDSVNEICSRGAVAAGRGTRVENMREAARHPGDGGGGVASRFATRTRARVLRSRPSVLAQTCAEHTLIQRESPQ
eukprot:6056126-Prymnesium_polylepis.1